MGERFLDTEEVAGSNPASPTSNNIILKNMENIKENISPEKVDIETEEEIGTEIEAIPSDEKLAGFVDELEQFTNRKRKEYEETEKLLEEHKGLVKSKESVQSTGKKRYRIAEDYINPFDRISSRNYSLLAREGIITEGRAVLLERLNGAIIKLEGIESPDDESISGLTNASNLRDKCQLEIEENLREKREEIEEKRERVKKKVIERHEKRIRKLQERIDEIIENPFVSDRMRREEEEEREEAKREREEYEREIIEGMKRSIQSLKARHENSFSEIETFTGIDGVADLLRNGLEDENKKQIIQKIRDRLRNAIIDKDDDEQLKDPGKVVPWKVHSSPYQYTDEVRRLSSSGEMRVLREMSGSGNGEAQKLLEEAERIIAQNSILREIIGAMSFTDGEGKKRMSLFWSAFKERKGNDKDGTTERNKKERKERERKKAEFKEKAEEMIGKGGFEVRVPIYGKGGKVLRTERAVLIVKKGESKAGDRKIWKVVEALGPEGATRLKNNQNAIESFPEWLQDAIKQHSKIS